MVYRKRLRKLIDAMMADVERLVARSWEDNPPRTLAQDEAPVTQLRKMFRELATNWAKRFDKGAADLAKHFAKASRRRSDAQLKAILRKAGMSVDFTMSRAMQDAMAAVVAENVGLIKSIPEQYLGRVEQATMRSVAAGRDMAALKKDISRLRVVTSRRAALIARDQNNKATASLQRVRQMELGITQAIWMHSYGGHHPRKSHLKNDGKRYDVAKGWYDPEEKRWIIPGELINCRCVSRSVIPGMIVKKPDAATMQVRKAAQARAR